MKFTVSQGNHFELRQIIPIGQFGIIHISRLLSNLFLFPFLKKKRYLSWFTYIMYYINCSLFQRYRLKANYIRNSSLIFLLFHLEILLSRKEIWATQEFTEIWTVWFLIRFLLIMFLHFKRRRKENYLSRYCPYYGYPVPQLRWS